MTLSKAATHELTTCSQSCKLTMSPSTKISGMLLKVTLSLPLQTTPHLTILVYSYSDSSSLSLSSMMLLTVLVIPNEQCQLKVLMQERGEPLNTQAQKQKTRPGTFTQLSQLSLTSTEYLQNSNIPKSDFGFILVGL